MINRKNRIAKRLTAMILSAALTAQSVPSAVFASESGELHSISSNIEEINAAWTLTFTADTGEEERVVSEIETVPGTAVGDLLPDGPERDGYRFDGWFVSESEVTSETVPQSDLTVRAKYTRLYTVTFVDGSETAAVLEVGEGEEIGELPAAPEKENEIFAGWFDEAAPAVEVTEHTVVNTDIIAAAAWHDACTVTFLVDGDNYDSLTVEKGTAAGALPAEPEKDGSTFLGWYVEEDSRFTSASTVDEDMTVNARFGHTVTFSVHTDDGTKTVLSRVVEDGSVLSALPQDPFREGSTFIRWVNAEDQTEVTADTVVTSDMEVIGFYDEINIYTVNVSYYYELDGREIEMDHTVLTIDGSTVTEESPLVIGSPSNASVSDQQTSRILYPTQPSVQVTRADLDALDARIAEDPQIERELNLKVEYIENNSEYAFVYLLRDPDGDGYTEIERENVHGVIGSEVTPPIRNYAYADFEEAETRIITEESGQEICVKYTRKDFTLIYDSQGGSSVNPVIAPYGTTVAISGTPAREGYDFKGWYLDKGCTKAAPAAISMTANTILYAGWEGKTVNYTIVYLKEKYDNASGTTNWVFDNSRTASGKVGAEVTAAGAPALTNNINGYEKDTERNAASKAVVLADGSTVVPVYYRLIRYTIVFNINNSDGRITIGGRTYSGSDYSIGNVVLGQDVSSEWPSSSNEIYDQYNTYYFSGWTGASATYITKRYEVIWDNVSKANSSHVMTFKASWSGTTYNRDAEYWVQSADDPNKWEVADAYTQIGLNTNNLGAKDLDGFTKHNSDASAPSGYTGTENATKTETVWVDAYTDSYRDDGGHKTSSPSSKEKTIIIGAYTYTFDHAESYWSWGNKYYYWYTCQIPAHEETVSTTKYTYRFYYDRNSYDIVYYDGGTELRRTESVPFDRTITGSDYNWTPEHPAGEEDYTWGGWYADSALQQKYTFGKMPGNNLALYANWIAPQYTVVFHNNYEGAEDVYYSQTLDKGKKESDPGAPDREYYRFLGWFTAPSGGSRYVPGAVGIECDLDLYAQWELIPLQYTVKYLEKDTGSELFSTKVSTSPVWQPGQEVSERAVNVPGYIPDASSKSISLAFEPDGNVITFFYGKKVSRLNYTVQYVLQSDHSVQVHEPKKMSVDSTFASVTEIAVSPDRNMAAQQNWPEGTDIETLRPVRNTMSLQLGLDEASNVIVFEYVPAGTVNVHIEWVDMAGQPIGKDAEEYHVRAGESVAVDTSAPGYRLARIDDNVNGEGHGKRLYAISGTETDINVQVCMRKQLMITAANKFKTYDGTALTGTGTGDVTVSGLVSGDVLTDISLTGSRTEIGTSVLAPSDAAITYTGGRGEGYYYILYTDGTLTVNPRPVTINIEPDRWNDGAAYDGTERTIGFRALRDHPEGTEGVVISDIIYENQYGMSIRDMVRDITLTEKDAGFYTIPASEIRAAVILPEDENYIVTLNVRDGELTIPPAQLTITTGSASGEYNGTALTNKEISVEGLAEGDSITAIATGAQTEPGSSTNGYELTWGETKESNYEITENLGTLTVTEHSAAVTLTAPSDMKVYDGIALTCDGTGEKKVEASGLPEGFTVDATATGSQTDAGSSVNVVNDGYVIRNAEGNDKTANFTNIEKVNGTLTVTPATVIITTGSASKAYDGTELRSDAITVEGLAVGESISVTATGTITEVGSTENTCSINWDEVKEGNYTVTQNLGMLTITRSDAEVVLTAPSDAKIYDGTALTCDGSGGNKVVATGLPEGFTIEASATGSQTDAGSSVNVVDEGYVIRDAEGNDRTDSFTNIETVDGTLTVNPAPVTITTGSASKAYDGTALTSGEISVEGLAEGESVTASATGTITEVGSTENTCSITWDSAKESNYDVTVVPGTLTITANNTEIILTAPSEGKVYDGSALTSDGSGENKVTAAGLPDGFSVEAAATGSQTDAGSSANVVNDGYVILDVEGNNRTEYFTNIKKADGTLTVTPAPVTITTGSAAKEYDGTALTSSEISVEGFITGESVTPAATGTITEVGSADNTCSITWDNAKESNYDVTVVTGTLTITANHAQVVLTAPSDTKVYDGNALTSDGSGENKVVAEGLPEGFSVEATATGSQTDAGSSANVVDDGYVIRDTEGNDRTASFANIKKADGTLTVNPAPVTITTGSASKEYDGTALTSEEISVEGLIEGESVTVSATGTVTEVGTARNTCSITWDSAKESNYDVTVVPGTLTITENQTEVILTAPSERKVYDGTALTSDGTGENKVTAAGLPDGFSVEATATGSQTDAGSSANVVDDGFVIRNAEGADRTASFANIATQSGTLTVVPKEVTVTAQNRTFIYTGEPQSWPEYDVDGLIGGDTLSAEVEGTVTLVSDNAVENTVTGHTFITGNPDNYRVVYRNGFLSVTQAEAAITIKAGDGEWMYDGALHQNTEVTVTEGTLFTGDILDASAAGSVTNVSDTAPGNNPVADGYRILHDGVDVTDNYAITVQSGTLTVTKRSLVLTSADGSKQYDAQALTRNTQDDVTVTGDGFAEGEGALYNFSGSQTLVGESKNAFTYELNEGTLEDNYQIETVEGTLTVTGDPIDDPVKETVSAETSYRPGDRIRFAITVKNITDRELTGVTIEDPTADIIPGDGYTVRGGIAYADIPAGSRIVVNAEHTVTSSDILVGTYENTASVSVDDVVKEASARTDDFEQVDTSLSVVKTAVSEPTDPAGYALGEEIRYEITVTNTGNVPYDNVTVSDELTGLRETIGQLPAGASETFETQYTVTSEDILRGTVHNAATASADPVPDPKFPDSPRIPEGEGTADVPTEEIDASIAIEKTAVSTPEDGESYRTGESVSYRITVTNTGNVPYTNVEVEDALTGLHETIAILAVGQTQTYTTAYTVTEADVTEGGAYQSDRQAEGFRTVHNVVSAKADEIPDPKNPEEPKTPQGEGSEDVPAGGSYTLTILYQYADGSKAAEQYTEVLKYRQTYLVDSPQISGCYADLPVVSGSMPAQDLTISVRYTRRPAVIPQNNMVTLTVRYLAEGAQVFESFRRSYRAGDSYSVTSPKLSGYTPDQARVAGTISADTTVDVVYTRNTYKLTVRYVYEDGSTAVPAYTGWLGYGEEYRITSPALSGYTTTLPVVTGRMSGRNVQYTVIYTRRGSIDGRLPNLFGPDNEQAGSDPVMIEDYGTPLGLGSTTLNAGECFE